MGRPESWLLLLGFLSAYGFAAEVPRPRGVGPDFAKFYKSPDTFTCISHPSIRIPVSRVNDDYCDCPDGSDEPGTSACSYISPLSPPSAALTGLGDSNATLALPGFYCKNKGHRPTYIPFTQVNDGVCDHTGCCDGSDEWMGVGGIKCEDRCKEIGKEWRKKDEARKKAVGAGMKKRKELVEQAAAMRKKLEGDIMATEGKVKEAEQKVAALQAELNEVEKRERGRVVKGSGGKLTALVTLAKDRVEELREALVSVRSQRDTAVAKVKELEQVLATFKDEYNPNFNDEGVKRAVRSWEEYAARKDTTSDEDMAAQERDLDEIVKPDGSEEGEGIRWQDWQEDETESDVDALYNYQAYLPASFRDWINEKMSFLREMLVSNGILAEKPSSSSGPESKTLQAARNALTSAQNDLNRERSRLGPLQEDLSRDYGPDDVFRSLKGICISLDSGEYTYELCFMERATQKPLKGRSGSNTNMGNFNRFETVWVDDDDEEDNDTYSPSNGESGPPEKNQEGKVPRLALKYDNGQHCWNGPVRSTTVVLSCAENDVIRKVVEEEKCVYRMDVGSTTICQGRGAGASLTSGEKSEEEGSRVAAADKAADKARRQAEDLIGKGEEARDGAKDEL